MKNLLSKMIALALAGCMILGLFPANLLTFRALAATGLTESDPHLIFNTADLWKVGTETSGSGNWAVNSYYRLMNDIALPAPGTPGIPQTISAGSNWKPIGDTAAQRFSGTFDGNGHSISGLIMNTTNASQGMFAMGAGGCVIKNLRLLDVNITGGNLTGGIMGNTAAGATPELNVKIQNCAVSGSITGGVSTGGIIGNSNGVTITGCYSEGTITGTGTAVGGIAGLIGTNGKILNCYSTADVESAKERAGGIIGTHNAANSEITGCWASGNVRSGTNFSGGIIGVFSNATGITTRSCIALSEEISSPGIAARISSSMGGTYEKLFAWGDMTVAGGSTGYGGTDLTTEKIRDKQSWIDAGFDFVNTWTWDDTNVNMPQLKWAAELDTPAVTPWPGHLYVAPPPVYTITSLGSSGGGTVELSAVSGSKNDVITITVSNLPANHAVSKVQILKESGGEVDFTTVALNSEYTFVMPNENVTVQVFVVDLTGISIDRIEASTLDPYIENGSTMQITLKGYDSANNDVPVLNAVYASEDTSLATVDAGGRITANNTDKLGRVKIQITADGKTALLELPVVGKNLIPAPHNTFDGGVDYYNYNTAKITNLQPGATYWRTWVRTEGQAQITVNKNPNYIRNGSSSIKFSFNGQPITTDVIASPENSNYIALGEAGAMYETTMYLKYENVDAPFSFGVMETYRTSAAVSDMFITTHKTQAANSDGWVLLETKPAPLLGESTLCNLRIGLPYEDRTTRPSTLSGDIYLSDVSYHKVIYYDAEFTSRAPLTGLSRGQKVSTSIKHFSNTGKEILPISNTYNSNPPVPQSIYRTSNRSVATVDSTGTVTATGSGSCTVTAETTISNVTVSKSLEVTVNPPLTAPKTITVNKIGGNVDVNTVVNQVATNQAYQGDSVTVEVSNIQAGYAFSSIEIKNSAGGLISSCPIKAGAEYMFIMPNDNITVQITVASASQFALDRIELSLYPNPFTQINSTSQIIVKGFDLRNVELPLNSVSYVSSDVTFATVDASGAVTALNKLGKITVTAMTDGKTAKLEIPIVGKNLLVINGKDEGAFENGSITPSAGGGRPFRLGIWSLQNYVNYSLNTEPAFLRNGSQSLKATFWGTTTNGTIQSDYVAITAGKLYELHGFVKYQNTKTFPTFGAMVEYANNTTGAGAVQTGYIPLRESAVERSDWERFDSMPSPTVAGKAAARIRLDTQTAKPYFGDAYFADLQFNEVVFDRSEFKALSSTKNLKRNDKVNTEIKHYTNTNNLITISGTAVPAAGLKTLYSSSDNLVATVDAGGVINARGYGTCIIYAATTIAGITKTEEIEVSVLFQEAHQVDLLPVIGGASATVTAKGADGAAVNVAYNTDEITVNISGIPAGYAFYDITVKGKNSDSVIPLNEKTFSQIYSFQMPDEPVDIQVEVKALSEIVLGEIEIETENPYLALDESLNVSLKIYDVTGRRMVLSNATIGYSIENDETEFLIYNDNSPRATVDANGVIRPATTNRLGRVRLTVTASISASSISRELEIPVVGPNMLKSGGLNHGNWEGTIGTSSSSNSWYTYKDTAYDATYFINSDPQFVKNKSRSLGIFFDKTKPSQQAQVSLMNPRPAIDSSKLYELAGWYKMVDATIKLTPQGRINFATTAPNVPARSTHQVELPGSNELGTTDWTPFTVGPGPGPNSADMTSANVQFYAGGAEVGYSGYMYISDVAFHEVLYGGVDFNESSPTDSLKKGDVITTDVVPISNAGSRIRAVGTIFPFFKFDAGFCTWDTTDPSVATVTPKGVITVTGYGECYITATSTLCGQTVVSKLPIKSSAPGSTKSVVRAEIDIPEAANHQISPNTVCQIFALCYDEDGILVDPSLYDSQYRVTYTSSNTSVATIDANGVLATKGLAGRTTITATVRLSDGVEKTAIYELNVAGKTRATIYTDEMRANARENVELYAWAKSERDAAVRVADVLVGREAELWRWVPNEGLPRSIIGFGLATDPNMYVCPNPQCKADIRTAGGTYNYGANPIRNQFKISCPKCSVQYPTNDFASYYWSGIDPDTGLFDYALAQQNGQEYLVNTSSNPYIRSLGPDWGVDDGFGATVFELNAGGARINQRKCPFIAAYFGIGLWGGNTTTGGSTPSARQFSVLYSGLQNLYLAYLYTGDSKYAVTGIILLDRIADVYPDHSIGEWTNRGYRANGYQGFVAGSIEDNFIAAMYCRAYDAFFPAMSNPKVSSDVVKFLSERAAQYPGYYVYKENPKTNMEYIKKNIEDRLLWAFYNGAKVAKLKGNFGMHQEVLALAAVAYDRQPETNTILDFLFAPDTITSTTLTTGGNVGTALMDWYKRDGASYENSPSYGTLGLNGLINIANAFENYTVPKEYSITDHVKFKKMFDAYYEFTTINRDTVNYGDSSSIATAGTMLSVDQWLTGYKFFKKNEYLQMAWLKAGGNLDNIHYNIFTKDPESIQEQIKDVVNQFGGPKLPSHFMTGAGLMFLRDSESRLVETSRNAWMHIGSSLYHGHFDALHLGLYAYGLEMAPDLGTYENSAGLLQTQFNKGTIGHNTVILNSKSQTTISDSVPYHFDDSGKIKLMDAESPNAYGQNADIYRRTVFMVEANPDVSYYVDFFRVKSASTTNSQIFSFHALSNTVYEVEGLELISKPGTYAGENTVYNSGSTPDGFTFLRNIRTQSNPQKKFSVDYKITDFRTLPSGKADDLHLRMTMVNDFALSDLTLAKGRTSTNTFIPNSEIEFFLARRNGYGLDSLFTTVFEPYKGQRYIKDIEPVENIAVMSGNKLTSDVYKAVKVTLKSGRVDYIVYCTNKNLLLNIDGIFDFQGFAGVYSIADGEVTLKYMNDGYMIGDLESDISAYTGTVSDFTRNLSYENHITITPTQPMDIAGLNNYIKSGKQKLYIYVKNDGSVNGAFEIHGFELAPNGTDVLLDIGDITTIRSYINASVPSLGYRYSIAVGNRYEIPLAFIDESGPQPLAVADKYVEAGSNLQFTVFASSPLGRMLTYSAKALPRGASFDPLTRTVTWTPETTQAIRDPYYIEILVNDGFNTAVITVKIFVRTSSLEKEPDGGGGGGSSGGGENPQPPVEEPEAPPSDPPEFLDLKGYDWAKEAINTLAAQGIIQGTTQTTFSPGANIKRGDFILLLVRALGIEEEASGNPFNDLDENSYYADAIRVAYSRGFITGHKGNFYPEMPITRQDLMVILFRAFMKKQVSGGLEGFSDVMLVSEYAKEAVEALVADGIITGSDGQLNPLKFTTRAEVALILYRILNTQKG